MMKGSSTYNGNTQYNGAPPATMSGLVLAPQNELWVGWNDPHQPVT